MQGLRRGAFKGSCRAPFNEGFLDARVVRGAFKGSCKAPFNKGFLDAGVEGCGIYGV